MNDDFDKLFFTDIEISKYDRKPDPRKLGITKISDTSVYVKIGKTNALIIENIGLRSSRWIVTYYAGETIKYLNKKNRFEELDKGYGSVDVKKCNIFDTLKAAFYNALDRLEDEFGYDITYWGYEDIEEVKLANHMLPTPWKKELFSPLEFQITNYSMRDTIYYLDRAFVCMNGYMNYNNAAVITNIDDNAMVSLTYNNGWTAYLYSYSPVIEKYLITDIEGDVYTVFDEELLQFDDQHTFDKVRRFNTPEEAYDKITEIYFDKGI